jgi:hypothetical protein
MAKVRKIPSKYTRGLKKSTAKKREPQIRKKMLGKVPKSEIYKPLVGDSIKPTRKSQYTYSLKDLRKRISMEAQSIRSDSLKNKFILATSRETGIPSRIIKRVYERGEAAWGTGGHRVGATQAAWAKARVYSFIQKGKTATTADKDLYKEAKKEAKTRKGFKLK